MNDGGRDPGQWAVNARFACVVLDVDSTLSAVEGIEWLAALRGAEVSERVKANTVRAMSGELPLEDVYAERLELVRPTRSEVKTLGSAYIACVSPEAAAVITAIRAAAVRVVVVSGGLRQGILPLTRTVGVPDSDVYAVDIEFTPDGEYAGFDASSTLARSGGKPVLVRSLRLPEPVLGVGDGATDAELRTSVPPAVGFFAAFTGVAAREPVVRVADYVVPDFSELLRVVMR